MTLMIPFDNTYAALPGAFHSKLPPVPVKAPDLLAFNEDLAAVLGISAGDAAEMAQVFGGNIVPEGPSPWRSFMPGTSLAPTIRSWATGARSCWARWWGATASAATSS